MVEAPAIIIVEAKKSDPKSGIGQCIAEMLAEQTVTIDPTDYPLPPIEQILSFLVWMVREG